MTQYDVLFTQNVASTGTEFSEKYLNIGRAGIITSSGVSTFTGSITTTVLTITVAPTDAVVTGMGLVGTGVTAGTTIVEQLTSTETASGTTT